MHSRFAFCALVFSLLVVVPAGAAAQDFYLRPMGPETSVDASGIAFTVGAGRLSSYLSEPGTRVLFGTEASWYHTARQNTKVHYQWGDRGYATLGTGVRLDGVEHTRVVVAFEWHSKAGVFDGAPGDCLWSPCYSYYYNDLFTYDPGNGGETLFGLPVINDPIGSFPANNQRNWYSPAVDVLPADEATSAKQYGGVPRYHGGVLIVGAARDTAGSNTTETVLGMHRVLNTWKAQARIVTSATVTYQYRVEGKIGGGKWSVDGGTEWSPYERLYPKTMGPGELSPEDIWYQEWAAATLQGGYSYDPAAYDYLVERMESIVASSDDFRLADEGANTTTTAGASLPATAGGLPGGIGGDLGDLSSKLSSLVASALWPLEVLRNAGTGR